MNNAMNNKLFIQLLGPAEGLLPKLSPSPGSLWFVTPNAAFLCYETSELERVSRDEWVFVLDGVPNRTHSQGDSF